MLGFLQISGIKIRKFTEVLLKDSARLFAELLAQLMRVISQKREELLGPKLNQQTYSVGFSHAFIEEKIRELHEQNFVGRLWANDSTLWHLNPAHQKIIRHRLGWLTITQQQIHQISRLQNLAKEIENSSFRYILLLGMGGSSLCAEVFRMTFGVVPGFPELYVLDSTVPAQVKSFENCVDLSKTVCIVASKSGATTESLALLKYFFDRIQQISHGKVGDHFIAITDPGSALEDIAREAHFREIVFGVPDIGGRYSALSNFGMVPAALMGVNVKHLLHRAERMRRNCDSCVPAKSNPGVVLGVTLGVLAKSGYDKVTFITSPAVSGLGPWLEQLLAESTGKEGVGIIPITDEPLGEPSVYGNDRVFAYIRYKDGMDTEQDAKVDALKLAGQPVICIDVSELINLGKEFFLWEMATAVASSLLGINAFDQPNVQESKDCTRDYLNGFRQSGCLQGDEPFFTDGKICIFVDLASRDVFSDACSLEAILEAHLSRVREGDYVALNAYVERTPVVHQIFQEIRVGIRNVKKVATTLGYGPRFLHSTGQLHKGGPNSGVFIQITSDDGEDLAIPGEPYTFGVLKMAQAIGDMRSLTRLGRRVISVHLGADVEGGLRVVQKAIQKILVGAKR